MIIEASQINSNGGIVLLELLLKRINAFGIKTEVYIAYDSVYEKLKSNQSQNVIFHKTTPLATLLRYMKRREKVLFFCNLPPFVKNKNSVYYIHNLFYVRKPEWTKDDSTIGLNLRKFIYYIWIRLFISKVSVVACQTSEMQRLIHRNLKKNALLLPFYEDYKKCDNSIEKEYDFFYPGSSDHHKNNIRLLTAIESALKEVEFRIVLTIDDRNRFLLNRIEEINSQYDYQPILNLGTITHEKVLEIYTRTKALMFPSLKESLGLPLIEATQMGLQVFASDLPFSHDVLINPLTFDPEDTGSIANMIVNFKKGKYSGIKQSLKVSCQMDKLLDLLK